MHQHNKLTATRYMICATRAPIISPVIRATVIHTYLINCTNHIITVSKNQAKQ